MGSQKRIFCFLSLFAVGFLSCQSNQWSLERFKVYTKSLNGRFPDNAPEIIYFIPVGGCHACVTGSIQFSKGQLNNRNILFILVSQTGRKSVSVYYDNNEMKASNLIVDGTGNAYQDKFIINSVTIYYREEDGYVRIDVDPAIFDSELNRVKDRLKLLYYKYSFGVNFEMEYS